MKRMGIVGIGMTAALVCASMAAEPADNARIGLPQDWSHQHVAMTNAASVDARLAAQSDPRMVLRWVQRTRAQARRVDSRPRPVGPPPKGKPSKKVDWSISLGPSGSVAPLAYPAKFSFDVNAVPSCTADFAVYPVNAVGVTGGQANLVAFNQLYRSTAGGLCGTGPGGSGLPNVM